MKSKHDVAHSFLPQSLPLLDKKQPKVFSHGEPQNVDITYHPPLVGGERNRFQDGGNGSSTGREQV